TEYRTGLLMKHFCFGGALQFCTNLRWHIALGKRRKQRIGSIRPCIERGEPCGVRARHHLIWVDKTVHANDSQFRSKNVEHGVIIHAFDSAAATLKHRFATEDDLVMSEKEFLAERFCWLVVVHLDEDTSLRPKSARCAVRVGLCHFNAVCCYFVKRWKLN
ncbi:MAG: hypothetical protein ACK56I_35315, partial [bacterium]